jgi:hypothetical protein
VVILGIAAHAGILEKPQPVKMWVNCDAGAGRDLCVR